MNRFCFFIDILYEWQKDEWNDKKKKNPHTSEIYTGVILLTLSTRHL